MSSSHQQILGEALKLPTSERANLAAELIESLDEELDEDVEEAWEEEIARRIRDYEAGRSRPIPWNEARKMIVGASDESAAT